MKPARTFIDASVFGVKASNGGAANNAGMAAALAAAWTSGIIEVRLPPGRLKFSLHGVGAGVGAIKLSQSVVIRGAGKELTTLKGDGFVEGSYTVDPKTLKVTITDQHDNGAMLFKVVAAERCCSVRHDLGRP